MGWAGWVCIIDRIQIVPFHENPSRHLIPPINWTHVWPLKKYPEGQDIVVTVVTLVVDIFWGLGIIVDVVFILIQLSPLQVNPDIHSILDDKGKHLYPLKYSATRQFKIVVWLVIIVVVAELDTQLLPFQMNPLGHEVDAFVVLVVVIVVEVLLVDWFAPLHKNPSHWNPDIQIILPSFTIQVAPLK